MASLSELIQLAQFQSASKQANSPLAVLGNLGASLGKSYQNNQAMKQRNRLSQMIGEDGKMPPGYSYEMGEDGGIKWKYDPSASKSRKTAHKIDDNLYEYDPETGDARLIAGGDFVDPNKPPEPSQGLKDLLGKEEERKERERIQSEKDSGYLSKINSWDDVGLLGRLGAAVTPSSTLAERKLGALRPGGIMMPPRDADKIVVKKSVVGMQKTPKQDFADEEISGSTIEADVDGKIGVVEYRVPLLRVISCRDKTYPDSP